MIKPTPKSAPIKFPPALLGTNAVAMIGVGLALAEIFPKHGHSPGLIPGNFVWPLLCGASLIVVLTTYKMIAIIRRHNQKSKGSSS